MADHAIAPEGDAGFPPDMPPPPVFAKAPESSGAGHGMLFLLCAVVSLGILALVCHFLETFKESAQANLSRSIPLQGKRIGTRIGSAPPVGANKKGGKQPRGQR